MDIWKPNAFHAIETLFLSWDLCTVEDILLSLMSHGVLTFLESTDFAASGKTEYKALK
jgi:hypothetical protein